MDRAQEIGASVRTLEDVGEAQYQQFRKERLIERTVNLKEPIKENRLISPSSSLTPQFHGIVFHTDLLTFLLTYFSKIMSFKNISPHGEIFLI